MSVFQVHPDISQARTIHSSFYTDPELFRATKEMIFSSTWQFVGNTDLVPHPGAVHPLILLPGYLDEPLLITRDKDQQLYCISNVCTHRGNLLADQACTVSHLRCKYHGRIFKLDGSYQSMPEFKEVRNFPSAADHLAQLLLFRWGKWLFTTLNGISNAELFLNEMIHRVAWMPIHEYVYRPELNRTYEVHAHWALYCENYLEGFHIPFVHADLNAVIDYGNYATELFEWSNLQVGFAKDADDCFEIPKNSPDHGKNIAAYYFWVFPNLMFNFYPWGLSVNVVEPRTPGHTVVKFYTYMYDETKYKKGAGGDLDKVELEDEAIVQQVQRGIRSRFYHHGRYSVTREQGTHHFHRLLARILNP